METNSKQIVTRIAPSPTGFLHIGTLRTALYNYLLAKKHGGKFLLRIEDTDRERLVKGSVENLIRVLHVMGLEYDEGPILVDGSVKEKGEHGPYTQSSRLAIYHAHVNQLVKAGYAYPCFCTKERLEETRARQQLAKLPTRYDRACCKLSNEEVDVRIENKKPYVIRMKIPEGQTSFQDEIRGVITMDNTEIDDQVLLKSDGFPTYHLAVVVDDHFMGVTHVIRGEEWISSAPKHVILYNWFQFSLPVYAHLPLILNPDKSKLSKRQGDVAVEDYLKKGYLPDALINFVALLGFNPTGDREIYTIQELTSTFELRKINKSGAVFNMEKLNWMNGVYIRNTSDEDLLKLCDPFLGEFNNVDSVFLKRIIHIEKERLITLGEISEKIQPYIKLKDYSTELLVWKKSDQFDAKMQLQGIQDILQTFSTNVFSSLELITAGIKEYISERELQNGNVLWPLRVSLSGAAQSANPFELLWILGKEESLARVTQAIERL